MLQPIIIRPESPSTFPTRISLFFEMHHANMTLERIAAREPLMAQSTRPRFRPIANEIGLVHVCASLVEGTILCFRVYGGGGIHVKCTASLSYVQLQREEKIGSVTARCYMDSIFISA